MRIRRAAQASVLLAMIAAAKSAFAAAPSFELSWTSSPSSEACTSRDDLRAAVVARLGRDPFVLAGAETVIDGRELRAVSGSFRATVEQRDREGHVLGTRDLEAPTCPELRRSTIFVLVLIVDPDAALSAPKPENPEAPAVAPPAALAPPIRESKTPAAPRAPAPRRRERAHLGVAIAISNGLLPRPDVGPVLTLGLTPSRAPIRLEWRGSYHASTGDVRGHDFFAVEQQWRGCFVLRARAGVFGGTACAGASWTVVVPDVGDLARGDQRPKQVFGPLVAAGPTVELGSGLRLAADLSVALPRPHYAFVFRDDDGSTRPLHEVGRIVWSLAIGATKSFW